MTSYSFLDHGTAHGTVNSSTGVEFKVAIQWVVRTGGNSLEGYWFFAGGATAPQKFCLRRVTGGSAGGTGSATADVVPGSVATSGTLTANSWNWIPLASPLPLAIGCAYLACTGYTITAPFANAGGYFSGGGTYPGGIDSGPGHAYSDETSGGTSGTGSEWGGWSQCTFTVNDGTDPTTGDAPDTPGSGSSFGMDVQFTDDDLTWAGPFEAAPNGGPNVAGVTDQPEQYVIATEEWYSAGVTADGVWFDSPPDATTLPDKMDVWLISSAGNVLTAVPAWSGAPGSGRVFAAFPDGTSLAAGKYRVSVYNSQATGSGVGWNLKSVGYFGPGGPGEDGITWGPLHVPGISEASDAHVFGQPIGDREPGQGTFANSATGPDQYPDDYADAEYQYYWLGLRVTPLPVTGTGSSAITLAATATGSPARSGHGSAAVSLAASSAGVAARAGTGTAAVALGARATGAARRGGTGTAVITLAATATTPAPPPVITGYPDVEHAVADLLADLGTCGTETRPSLAATLPYIRITRTGGADDLVTDTSTVSVDVFGASADDAKATAEAIRQRLTRPASMLGVDRQTGHGRIDRAATVTGPNRLPPTDSGNLRMVVASYSITMRR